MPGLPKVTNITASIGIVYALGEDGSLWTWGSGSIDDGSVQNHLAPHRVPNLPRVADIVFGGLNGGTSYAIGEDGSLWAWGYNRSGQVGDGTTTDRATPVKVNGLPKVTSIHIEGYDGSVYATGEDGSLWAWGANWEGQIGDESSPYEHTVPYKVPGLPKVANVITGSARVYAIGEDGSLWAWGNNRNGQIGDGTSGADNARRAPYNLQFWQ